MRYLGSVIVVACAFVAVLGAAGQAEAAPRPIKVGVVTDGGAANSAPLIDVFMSEIIDLNATDFAISAPKDKRVYGNLDAAAIKKGLEGLMADPDVQVVLALGPVASHIGARMLAPNKPLFAPFILDPTLQGLPLKGGRSGVANLNYLTVPYDMARALGQMKALFGARKIGFVSPGGLMAAAPNLGKGLVAQASTMGLSLSIIPIEGDVDKALAALDKDVDAVLVTPLNNLKPEQAEALIAGINARKLPSFSYLSSSNIERGILSGDLPKRFIERMRRRLALNVQRALLGENPSTFPVFFEAGATRLWLNLDTARTVGYEPPWSVFLDAKTIQARPQEGPALDLDGVLSMAAKRNLDIRSQMLQRDSGLEDIRQARANLLPSLDLTATGRMIDSDRAVAGNGSNPQFSGAAQLSAQQLIYSDGAWAGLSIQESLQDDRDAALRAFELDVVQLAAVAYLNVLRAQSLIEINTRNLEAARENLELALVRERVGSATAADPLRWKSEIARGKRDLIQSYAGHVQARIQLNRLLDQPEMAPFTVSTDEIQDHALLRRFESLMTFLTNRSRLQIFGDFLAEEAITNAPEIARLDAAIEIQNRDLTRIDRSYYIPDIILQADVSTSLFSAGDGSETPALPPGTETPDDFNLDVLLIFSLPLYDGGARYAAGDQLRIELARLQLDRDSLAQKLRQNIRSEVFNAMANFQAIELSREQASAANESLAMVTRAYAAGSVSIADLIDAQSNAFAAEQGVVNAIYDFMITMANVERAMGVSRIFVQPGEQLAFFNRLSDFYESRGAERPSLPTTP